MKNLPKAYLRAGEICKCVCHRLPEINHAFPCCFPNKEQLREEFAHLTDEDLKKLKDEK